MRLKQLLYSTPISGSYIAASQIQNTGNFVFDSTSDSSNTGLAISNLRIYNRSLSYEEMEFKKYVGMSEKKMIGLFDDLRKLENYLKEKMWRGVWC